VAAFVVHRFPQTGIKRSENLHAWVRAGDDVTQERAVKLRLLLYVLVNFRCWKIASLGYVVASLLAPPVTSPSCHQGIVMTGGVLLPAWGISSQIRAPPADRNPEIVDQIVFPLGAAASDLEPIAGRSVDELVGAGGNAAPDLNRSGAEMTEELDESGTTAEEQAVAEAPQYEAEPAGANEGTPRGVRRRPEHAHHR
jgi:hypothetical protein